MNFKKIVESKLFKRATLVLGIIFIIITIAIAIDPKPFLSFGYLGAFLISVFGIATIAVPSLSFHFNIFLLALVMALGNTINDSVSYLVGKNSDEFIKRSNMELSDYF